MVPANTALQSDRFAREIVRFLNPSRAARSRQLKRKMLDGNLINAHTSLQIDERLLQGGRHSFASAFSCPKTA
jgi:hypothetical protein